MPLVATRGAASAQGFGEFAQSGPAIYIEDVFSTYLYTGNGSSQTITNGIDLSGKGGLVWFKSRSTTNSHRIFDTARGIHKFLNSSDTGAQTTNTSTLTAFNSTGFDIGSSSVINTSGELMASWTFREQPKFFDVVTYTGNGNSVSRNVSHNLGSVAGTIIVKRTDSTSNWAVAAYDGTNWKVGTTTTPFALNLTNASTFDVGSVATSTTFNVCRMQWSSGGNPTDDFNASGATYVAYLFAHNAGGFGLTGTDNVISCGSFTTDGSGVATVNLGYEPQWLLIKQTTGTRGWFMYDNMRGMFANGGAFELLANSSASEQDYTAYNNIAPTATGFVTGSGTFYSSTNYIYIAIRRGPMKTPTSGTSVFSPTTYTGNGTSQTESAGFPTDMAIITNRGSGGGYERNVGDRLRGGNRTLFTTLTVAENTATNRITAFDNMVGVSVGSDGDVNQSSGSQIAWNFRRAPGFFDEVCYTGTGSATTFSHNLGVVPEMMIVKRRNSADNWFVYSQTLGNTKHIALDGSSGASGSSSAYWNNTSPTASVFSVGTDSAVNASASTYVNYLFASCPGVSKVGSYTGTGTTLQIDCGFTGGARFVLIKRTDSTGDWYVWDSARGIVSGNDPYLLLNSTAAEVTNTDYVDTYSAGFEISSTAPAAINANGGTFIFLAVA